jgi:hypothetical protein
MTTQAKAEANRKNALLSTGPRSAAGKERASRNALRHGLRSEALAVLPFEAAAAWEEHRDGVVRSLAPAGALEQALAIRVALCLWRLQRVAVFEAATATAAIGAVSAEAQRRADRDAEDKYDDAFASALDVEADRLRKAEKKLNEARLLLTESEEDMAAIELIASDSEDASPVGGGAAGNLLETSEGQLPEREDDDGGNLVDDALVLRLGVPKQEISDCWEWDGWTIGMVRQGMSEIAATSGFPEDKLLARTLKVCRQDVEAKRQQVAQLNAKAQAIRRRVKVAEDQDRLNRLLPDTATLDKLTRYEAHVSRQLYQALHELEGLQALRAAAAAIAPPAPLDVTVAGPMQALENAAEGR